MYHWVKFFYVKIKMMFKIIKFTKNYNIYKNCTKNYISFFTLY